LADASLGDLCEVEGVGRETAAEVVHFFESESGRELTIALADLGVSSD